MSVHLVLLISNYTGILPSHTSRFKWITITPSKGESLYYKLDDPISFGFVCLIGGHAALMLACIKIWGSVSGRSLSTIF